MRLLRVPRISSLKRPPPSDTLRNGPWPWPDVGKRDKCKTYAYCYYPKAIRVRNLSTIDLPVLTNLGRYETQQGLCKNCWLTTGWDKDCITPYVVVGKISCRVSYPWPQFQICKAYHNFLITLIISDLQQIFGILEFWDEKVGPEMLSPPRFLTGDYLVKISLKFWYDVATLWQVIEIFGAGQIL